MRSHGWLLLCALATVTARSGDLRLQAEAKITPQMVGAPVGVRVLPEIWALSFSPDGKKLAIGVQLASDGNGVSLIDCFIVVAADHPGEVLRKFTVPTEAKLRSLHKSVWSSDGRFVAVKPWGRQDRTAIVDLSEGRLEVLNDPIGTRWCGDAASLLPGPLLLQWCALSEKGESVVRLVGLDGTAAPGWTFPAGVNLLDTSSDAGLLALDIPDKPSPGHIRSAHEMVIFRIADRSEVQRWRVSEGATYAGAFAGFGNSFCVVADLLDAGIRHSVVCRELATGQVISTSSVPNRMTGIVAAGNNLLVSHVGVITLPFRMFGTDAIFTSRDQFLLSGKGQVVAKWRLPRADAAGIASAFTEAGHQVAITQSGSIWIYDLRP